MRKVLPIALVALTLPAARPVSLDAWGYNGHKLITDRAIDLLPQEIRPFFQKFRTTVVEHAIDPDTYRTVGFVEETPRHFLDMDAYGPFPFKDLPHDYKEAVAKRGLDFVLKNGTVPWRTEEMYNRLRDAFKQLAEPNPQPWARDDIKLFSAVMSHYVGDSFQPLHACVNYDGQLTGQQGIHSRFETEMFDRYQDKLRIAPAPVTPIPNAREFVFSTLTDTFTYVDAILAADREAIQGRTVYDDGYFAKLFEKTGPIMEKRISGAITGVASLIAQAWIDAGKPALPVDAPLRPPRPIKRYGVRLGPDLSSIAASIGPITSSTPSVIAPAMIARRY
jgi:zinc dependent phospholipase C